MAEALRPGAEFFLPRLQGQIADRPKLLYSMSVVAKGRTLKVLALVVKAHVNYNSCVMQHEEGGFSSVGRKHRFHNRLLKNLETLTTCRMVGLQPIIKGRLRKPLMR